LSEAGPGDNRNGRNYPACGTAGDTGRMDGVSAAARARRRKRDQRRGAERGREWLLTRACRYLPAPAVATHAAIASTTTPATKPGCAYSAGLDCPVPVTNRWLSDGNDRSVTFGRSPTAAR